MAQELIIYTKCPHCKGTGQIIVSEGENGQTIPCNWAYCNNGYIELSKITFNPSLVDLMNKHDITQDKCDTIQSKCDTTHDKCDTIIDKCDQIIGLLQV